MKNSKIVFFLFVLTTIMASSCNKKYTCAKYGIVTEIYYSKDYTPAQLLALDSFCVQNGGVWEVYNP